MCQLNSLFIGQKDLCFSVKHEPANSNTPLSLGDEAKITLAPAKMRVKAR